MPGVGPHRRPRVARSDRLLRVLPTALLEYPLEVLLAAWGLISGIPLLAGVASPTPITRVLPDGSHLVWAGLLVVAGLTIAVGLATHRYASLVARGLQLLGAVCLAYAVAILATAGWKAGIPGGPLLTVIAALCYLRAWWMRARAAVMDRIRRAAQ